MWDQRYDVPEYIFGEAPCQWLTMNRHRLPTEGDVLALGDGDGRNGVHLAEWGLSVTSVDLSSVGLAKARRLAESRGVSITTICADLADHRIESQSLDLIVSIYCHLPEAVRTVTHTRCVEGLRPGGLFVLEAFNQQQLGRSSGGPQTTDLLYDIGDLLRDFRRLEVVEALTGLCDLNEGDRHKGLGQVVRLVLRKPPED
jgi:SAM-dependent methyltransferase